MFYFFFVSLVVVFFLVVWYQREKDAIKAMHLKLVQAGKKLQSVQQESITTKVYTADALTRMNGAEKARVFAEQYHVFEMRHIQIDELRSRVRAQENICKNYTPVFPWMDEIDFGVTKFCHFKEVVFCVVNGGLGRAKVSYDELQQHIQEVLERKVEATWKFVGESTSQIVTFSADVVYDISDNMNFSIADLSNSAEFFNQQRFELTRVMGAVAMAMVDGRRVVTQVFFSHTSQQLTLLGDAFNCYNRGEAWCTVESSHLVSMSNEMATVAMSHFSAKLGARRAEALACERAIFRRKDVGELGWFTNAEVSTISNKIGILAANEVRWKMWVDSPTAS